MNLFIINYTNIINLIYYKYYYIYITILILVINVIFLFDCINYYYFY